MDDGYPPSQLPDDIDAQTASGADLPRPDTTLDPSLVGEYVTFERCPRYFIFKGQDRHESEFFHRERFDEAFRPLNPLLSKAGTEFEEHIEGELAPLINRKEDLDEADQSIESAQATLYRECQTAIERNIDDDDELSDTKPVALLQTPLKGRIGAWDVYGDADIILIWPANAGVRVRIIDIKSAKEQKTYHQIQTAIYTILFKQWVESRDDVAMDEVIIEGGVITRADDIDDACPEGIPEFSLSEREADIRSLCRHGGPLHRLYFTELEEADYTIEDKCAGCSYNEACHSDVIESRGLAMLGVSPGQQETLRQHNIETIDELAELRYQPEDEHRDPQAPTSPQVRRNHKETYRSLLNEPDIGASLSELIERAHYLSGRLTEHAANLDTGTDAKLLSRPSYSQLPDDDPREASDIDYPAMSLVRVYLNIQYDNLRDTLILASARITATASETDPIRISELVDPTPKDEDKIREAEREALERFVSRLGEGIEAVVDELDIEASDYDSTALHFYVFSRDERSNLLDTLDRHRDSERVDALKRLLDGRKGVDQPMLSTIRTAVWTRYGLRTPSPGLLHLFGQFGSRYSYSKPRYDWKYTPASKGSDDWADGETEVDLRQVFSWRLFATSVAYESDGDGYSLQPESQSSSDGDGLYPSRARYGAEIPLGYLWAAGGRIDEKWIEEADKQIEYDKDTLDAFRFHDPKKQVREIEARDVKAVGRHFCDALEHIERDIDYKSHQLGKKSVDPHRIEAISWDETTETATSNSRRRGGGDSGEAEKQVVDGNDRPSLAKACLDYLHLENEVRSEEHESLLQKPMKERILSGRSIPVRVNSVADGAEGGSLTVEGELLYEELYTDGETVKQRCRKNGERGATGGSWMVLTPAAHRAGEDARSFRVARNPKATIKNLDLDVGEVTFSLNRYRIDSRFTLNHDGWTTNETEAAESDKVYVGEGEIFLLDPQVDDIVSSRCASAIEQADSNHLYELVEALADGTYSQSSVTDSNGSLGALPPAEDLDNVFNWVNDHYGPSTLPSTNQSEFIEAYESQIQLLQGPPGTGKTGGSEGPAIAVRTIAAANSEQGFAGLVTGPSNRSIDEVMESTVEVLHEYQQDSDTDDIASNLSLVRLTSGEPNADETLPLVDYVDYNTDTDAVEKIGSRLRAQERNASGDDSFSVKNGQMRFAGQSSETVPNEQTIIFATPSRSWKLLEKIEAYEEDEATFADTDLWDLLAVDEGSMMTMPTFLMAGAGLRPDGQVLVAGDHRQMPPVQQHEFDEERRGSIRAWVPYLSVLDFFRVLEGELGPVPEEHHDALEIKRDPDEVTIPMAQLEAGRRCPESVTDVLYDHVYQRDNLEYDAVRDPKAVPIVQSRASPGVNTALSEEATMSLIVYDDDQHGQTNPIEVALSKALLAAVPDGVDAGLVTPHNAQRGTLTRHISQKGRPEESAATKTESGEKMDENLEDTDGPTIDTVERYQGDERELMVVSATVSDPNLIASEDKFLLSENRATVALSRVKDQLVVIVAESVIEHIPTDTELYNEASLWKRLAEYAGYTNESAAADWDGSLEQFTSNIPDTSVEGEEVSIVVYSSC